MKKLIIAGAVLAGLYYIWSRTNGANASTAGTGANNLNNPAQPAKSAYGINLTGSPTADKTPGLRTVS